MQMNSKNITTDNSKVPVRNRIARHRRRMKNSLDRFWQALSLNFSSVETGVNEDWYSMIMFWSISNQRTIEEKGNEQNVDPKKFETSSNDFKIRRESKICFEW